MSKQMQSSIRYRFNPREKKLIYIYFKTANVCDVIAQTTLDLGTKDIPINIIIEVYQAFINMQGDRKVTEYLVFVTPWKQYVS